MNFQFSISNFPHAVKDQRGQAIVESIVAITVLIMVFVGVWGLLSSSFRFNRYIADNYTATYLAAEGIEVVKNLLDANVINRRSWSCGFASGDYELVYDTLSTMDCDASALSPNLDRKLFLDSASGLYTYNTTGTTGLPTDFTRLIKIAVDTAGNPQEIHVNSIVSWRQGFSQKNVDLEDRFFNWHP